MAIFFLISSTVLSWKENLEVESCKNKFYINSLKVGYL